MRRHVVPAERFGDVRLRSAGLHSAAPDVASMPSLHNAAGYLNPRRAVSSEPGVDRVAISEAQAMGAVGPSPQELKAKDDLRLKKKGLLRKQQEFLQEQSKQTLQQQEKCQEQIRIDNQKLVEAEARAAKAEVRAELVLQQAERMEKQMKERLKEQADRAEREQSSKVEREIQQSVEANSKAESAQLSRVLSFCEQFEARLTSIEKERQQQSEEANHRATASEEASRKLFAGLPQALQLKIASGAGDTQGDAACGGDAAAAASFDELLLGLRGLVDHTAALLASRYSETAVDVAAHAESPVARVGFAEDADPNSTLTVLLGEGGSGGKTREELVAERMGTREKRRKAFAAASEGLSEAMLRVSGLVSPAEPVAASSSNDEAPPRASSLPGQVPDMGPPVAAKSSRPPRAAKPAALQSAPTPSSRAVATARGAVTPTAPPPAACGDDAPFPLHAFWRKNDSDGDDKSGSSIEKAGSEIVKIRPVTKLCQMRPSWALAFLAALMMTHEVVMVPLLAFRQEDAGFEVWDSVQFLIPFVFAAEIIFDRRRLALDFFAFAFDLLTAAVVLMQFLDLFLGLSVLPAKTAFTIGASLRVARLARSPITFSRAAFALRPLIYAHTSGSMAERFDRVAWMAEPTFSALACGHAFVGGLYAVHGVFGSDNDGAWVAKNPANSWEDYVVAAGWSVSQFTFASSDVQLQNTPERAFAVLSAIVAIALTARILVRALVIVLPAGGIKEARQGLCDLGGARRFLEARGVPKGLRRRAMAALAVWQDPSSRATSDSAAASALAALSSELGGEVNHRLWVDLIAEQHPLWQSLTEGHALATNGLFRCLQHMSLAPNAPLFAAGQMATKAYVLVAGEITYTRASAGLRYGVGCGRCCGCGRGDCGARTSAGSGEEGEETPAPRRFAVGTWLAEPALWVSGWVHRGRAQASGILRNDSCELLSLADLDLQDALLQPGCDAARAEAAAFARAFVLHSADTEGWQNVSDVLDPPALEDIYRLAIADRKVEEVGAS